MLKYFPTRDAARKFANENKVSMMDAGKDATKGQRWYVDVTNTVNANDTANNNIIVCDTHKDAALQQFVHGGNISLRQYGESVPQWVVKINRMKISVTTGKPHKKTKHAGRRTLSKEFREDLNKMLATAVGRFI